MSNEEMNRVRGTLVRIAENAMEAGMLDFLVIGGNAVIAHGVPRFTRDVDFVVPESDQSSWRSFLADLGYHFIHGTPAFAQFQSSDEGELNAR